jgi:hypothetical protein
MHLLLTEPALQRIAIAAALTVFSLAITFIATGRAALPTAPVHRTRQAATRAVSRRTYQGRHHLKAITA